MTDTANQAPLDNVCGANKKSGGTCRRPSGWGTDHPGVGRCKLHGGASPIKSGRYSKIKRESLRQLIAEHEADPDPLNIFPELAAARALFQDFIERYDRHSEALIAWHQSYQTHRPIDPEKAGAFMEVIDAFEERLVSQDDLTDRQQQNLLLARQYVTALREPSNNNKPTQILDIGDAYRIVSEITKIVERIERIRAANAVSRNDLIRIMTEMSRVVQTYVSDQELLDKIKGGWLQIRVG
jgi:hypothetical protein